MQKKPNASLLGRFAAGVPAAIVFALLSLLISAVILEKEASASLYFPLLLGAAGVSGVVGGVFATRKERKSGLVNGALAAVLPMVIYLIAATVIRRRFEFGSLLPCLALLVGSVVAGILVANRKTKVKIKKRK
ncbi:MAG: TIGR04086 family membrane protein [Clostridia bacterium]|nr:TIGR04086 family membrane protein [Clostridia bacterium]